MRRATTQPLKSAPSSRARRKAKSVPGGERECRPMAHRRRACEAVLCRIAGHCGSARWTHSCAKRQRPGLGRRRRRGSDPRGAHNPGRRDAMIEHRLDTCAVNPLLGRKSALEKAGFVQLAKSIDPTSKKPRARRDDHRDRRVPGWDSLGAMAAHFRFVRDHQAREKGCRRDRCRSLGLSRRSSRRTCVCDDQASAGQSEAARQWIMST